MVGSPRRPIYCRASAGLQVFKFLGFQGRISTEAHLSSGLRGPPSMQILWDLHGGSFVVGTSWATKRLGPVFLILEN